MGETPMPLDAMDYHSPRRWALISPRRFLESSRRRFAPALGFVFLRRFGSTFACTISSRKRSITSWRLPSWLRSLSDTMWISSAFVSRLPAAVRSRAIAVSRNPRSAVTGTQISALVFSLLTFCPPGPPLRAYWRRSASRGIVTPGASSMPPLPSPEVGLGRESTTRVGLTSFALIVRRVDEGDDDATARRIRVEQAHVPRGAGQEDHE